jgi:hypothetical protein
LPAGAAEARRAGPADERGAAPPAAEGRSLRVVGKKSA